MNADLRRVEAKIEADVALGRTQPALDLATGTTAPKDPLDQRHPDLRP